MMLGLPSFTHARSPVSHGERHRQRDLVCPSRGDALGLIGSKCVMVTGEASYISTCLNNSLEHAQNMFVLNRRRTICKIEGRGPCNDALAVLFCSLVYVA